MKQYLKHSIPTLAAVLLVGSLLSHKSSTALAESKVNLPIAPLAEMADSLNAVSLGLDTAIDTLVVADSIFYSSISMPVESQELRQLVDSASHVPVEGFAAVDENRPDAFVLSRRIAEQQNFIDTLKARLLVGQDIIEHLPTLVPCNGSRSSGFGVRFHPIYHTEKMHTGVDLAAPTGTPIYSAGSGTVVFAGWQHGYGNVVEIDHGYGYHTLYGHSSKLLVKVGDKVMRGDRIALVGSTGGSTGPHLHYETIVDSVKINPEPFLLDRSIASVTVAEKGNS
jgi:murein DD-endopeptidase MepM/ murein hydrolase activator NlpD